MYWHFSIFGVLFISYVLAKVKNDEFAEGKSILWITGAILILVLSLFPEILVRLSALLGVDYPPSLLFLFSILFLVFMTFQQDHDISLLTRNEKGLAQRVALLEQALAAGRRDEGKDRRDRRSGTD